MEGDDVDVELFPGCVAGFAAVNVEVNVEMSEENQGLWNTVMGRKGGRRLRSPGDSPVESPVAKRVCQDNPYQVLTPQVSESVEEVGESPQLNFSPPETRSSRKRREDAERLVADMCTWDQVSEGLRCNPEQSVSEECVVEERRTVGQVRILLVDRCLKEGKRKRV